jgi:hypothetical protein
MLPRYIEEVPDPRPEMLCHERAGGDVPHSPPASRGVGDPRRPERPL